MAGGKKVKTVKKVLKLAAALAVMAFLCAVTRSLADYQECW